MTIGELRTALGSRKALIVHMSHHLKMRGDGVFPDDLQQAIANKDRWLSVYAPAQCTGLDECPKRRSQTISA
jgi:hypothetical protein